VDNNCNKFISDADHAYLNGIQTQRIHQFLSASQILKLVEIEKKYDVNLSISKQIRNIVKKYYNETHRTVQSHN
jgi:uncharacterized linocin/CFP29 family protein